MYCPASPPFCLAHLLCCSTKVMDPEVPQALRLQAILMGGIVIVHAKQEGFLLEDAQEMLVGAGRGSVVVVSGLVDGLGQRQAGEVPAGRRAGDAGGCWWLLGEGRWVGHRASGQPCKFMMPSSHYDPLSLDW